MIYFDRETKLDLVNRFYEVTEPGGYLFIGHSEFLEKDRIKDEYERIASTSYCPMIKNEGTPLAQMMANEYKKVEQKYWNEINQKCPASSCNQNDFNLDPFRFCHF